MVDAAMDAAAELRAIWVAANKYLQSAAPWAAFKADPDRAAATVRFAFNLIRLYAILSRPFLPEAAARMLAALGHPEDGWPTDVAEAIATLGPGHRFEVPEVLFAKIDDARRIELEGRFAGAA